MRKDGPVLDQGKQRDILTAAQELFGEVGYDKTSVREIAKRANVALGTVYAHFGNGKIGVLEAALDDRIDRLTSYAFESLEIDPVEQFLDHVRRLNSELVRDPLLARILSERGQVSEPRLRERGWRIEELFLWVAATRLRELDREGLVRCADPEAVVTLLRVATQGWLLSDAGSWPVSHDRMLETLLDAVRALIAAP